MNILITGASGFVGGHLIESLLASSSDRIFGTCMAKDPSLNSDVRWLEGDLADPNFAAHCIELAQPDRVYHLAALSSAGKSFAEPLETLSNNIAAEFYLLEAIRLHRPDARVLIVGSIDEYGATSDEAVDESSALRPISPYGVSKISQDFLALQYALSHKLLVVRVRPSNHIGPRQREEFVVPAFCKQVAMINAGLQDPVVHVGNLAAIRDFTDVRDMVRAYQLAIEQGRSSEVYVLGSGQPVSIKEVLHKIVGFGTKKVEIEVDQSKFRPLDVPRLVANAKKFVDLTGWKTTITLDQSLHDIVNYWAARLEEAECQKRSAH